MAITSPQQLLALKLQHIQDAENEASSAIQEIRSQVQNSQLQQLLDRRLREGQEVLQGIQQALPKLDGQGAGDPQNHAARGIIQEGRTLLSEIDDPNLKEAIAIGSVQSLEHYCIATWGTVKALARQMGEQQIVEVMQRALDSGKQLDQELTQLAESRVNPQAMEEGQSRSQGGGAAQASEGPQAQA
jgi:ferritin-like metal-binding protein YciE